MGLLKAIVVIGALICAAIFLGSSLGASIPSLKYKDFESHDIPVGIAFLVFAVAIARFWKIEHHFATEEIVLTKADGSQEKTTRKSTRSFKAGP
jgi:hypothetical protein